MWKKLWIVAVTGLVQIYAQTLNTEFADKLVSYHYSHTYMFYDDIYGGIGFNFPIPVDPHVIEGANMDWFVSLPTGSYVILEFTNNKIIDYPNQDDIFVTENGCNNEKADIYVSADGKKFTKLGTVDDCYISSLDLAAIGYKEDVKFVKVVGLDMNGGSPGFDLVNVKGLPKSSIEVNDKKNADAMADSLDNLANYGFQSKNLEGAAGPEWVFESKDLNEAEFTLYDPDKNKVSLHYRSIEVNKIVIDASGLKKGIYILEIKRGTEIITQKINIV